MGWGKLVAPTRGEAVQAFLVKNHRNAEAAVFAEKFLRGVGEFRHRAHIQPAAEGTGAANLAEAVARRETRAALWPNRNARVVGECFRNFLPNAHHLRGLFLDGHAREQILHAALRRQRRVLISAPERLSFAGARQICIS